MIKNTVKAVALGVLISAPMVQNIQADTFGGGANQFTMHP